MYRARAKTRSIKTRYKLKTKDSKLQIHPTKRIPRGFFFFFKEVVKKSALTTDVRRCKAMKGFKSNQQNYKNQSCTLLVVSLAKQELERYCPVL